MGIYIEPFDFETLFIEYFLGNQNYLVYALILLLSALCGYYQMSNRNYIIILIISCILLAAYIGSAFVGLILFLLGFIGFKIFGRIFT